MHLSPTSKLGYLSFKGRTSSVRAVGSDSTTPSWQTVSIWLNRESYNASQFHILFRLKFKNLSQLRHVHLKLK